ncbi:metallopeptidase TldD-related protein [Motilimonas sp. E26]|uniref:metallopeptidase TldD-related protein n=1 Tax=Motilimonas sp. E26 TaxID=2865674 RepID=UPI001E47E6E0|nr:metallopeptidase TldD-related protein [Motilimonas sp. E26]MCE0555669.1 hypothetical protein [Motilimonas sp. E26]
MSKQSTHKAMHTAMQPVLQLLTEINTFMKNEGITGSITYRQESSHMVRCGRSQISLNVSEEGEKYFVEIQASQRKISGSTTAQANDSDKLKTLVSTLNERVKLMPEVAHMSPMTAIVQGDLNRFNADGALINLDSKVMVDLFKRCGEHFAHGNVEVSGAFSAGVYSYAIINTLVDAPVAYQGSDYNVELVLQLLDHDKKELRVADVGEALNQFDANSLIKQLDASYQLLTNTPRQDIEPGEYDVIFHADAFGDLINYLGYMALHGETYQYGMGMLQQDKHQIGSQLFGSNFTITDDPTDPEVLFARPVGENGIARQPFPLISDGVLSNQFYSDKDDCDRFGIARNNDMDVASIKVATGNGPTDFAAMVKSCTKPTLFISFIHYMNLTNAAKGEFTGSSRFGTFLIADGEIKAHLYNQRINDSYHRIFNQIEWLSSQLHHVNMSSTYGMRSASSIACPRFVKVNKVKITGSSAPGKG